MKMKNRSLRSDINKLRARLGHKCTRYKKRLSMMMLICL